MSLRVFSCSAVNISISFISRCVFQLLFEKCHLFLKNNNDLVIGIANVRILPFPMCPIFSQIGVPLEK